MARGRPRLSPEAKSAKKERAEADKASALAQNALAKLPAEKEKRDELWQELDALKSEASGVSGSISAQKKRMTEVFGITKAAMQIRAILNKCRAGEYEATVEQIQLFMQDTNRPIQLSMKLEPGKGVAEDQGSVFDASHSGETVSAERGDDPGRARKSTIAPPAPPAPSAAISLDEARAKFEANKAAGDERRAKRGGPPAPPETKAKDDFEDGKDVRPRALKEAEAQRASEAEAKKAKTDAAATENMTPAQKRAHAKKIADEVFAKQGNKGLGADGIH